MLDNVIDDPDLVPALTRVDRVVNKIKYAIELYEMGLWPTWVLSAKLEEYTISIMKEVANG